MHPEPTRLVLALHFHQPFGNLDRVFAEADHRCYQPTLALLAKNPHVRTAIHVSGPLLDWLEEHSHNTLLQLKALVERGQVEVMGGGYQEPMLAILPDRDAQGQLLRMATRCEDLLGARPSGMWLAERVWEPDLARTIAQAGYRYTLLDDTHLQAAGAASPLGAYYVTDKAGHSLAVLPIDRGLRTRIPFADVQDVMAYLGDNRGRVLCYGDDAEKFGLWPSTERRVWQQGWLQQFADALKEQASWLHTVLPSEVIQSVPCSGSLYIPTISYAEMGGWALPAQVASRYQTFASRLAQGGFEEESASFLRGGIWQAFLAKYPESNLIYRKMLRVSKKVAAAEEAGHPNHAAAQQLLYQGQCNCAYWHGLFGGLYLQHLRAALMQALIQAENLLDDATTLHRELSDHDGDWNDELLLEGPALNAYFSANGSGQAFEIDLRQARHHLTGVIARRWEAYHVDVARAQVISDEELDNISAHDLVRATEEGLADKLRVDRAPRGAFVDHVFPRGTGPDAFDREAPCYGNWKRNFRVHELGDSSTTLRCNEAGIDLEKSIEMHADSLEVKYRIRADSDAVASGAVFASEFDFTLLTPESVGGRRLVVQGHDVDLRPGATGCHHNVTALRIVADSMQIDATLELSHAATLWRLPIETVSQSEQGFERSYQGTALVFSWPLKDEMNLSVTLKLTPS